MNGFKLANIVSLSTPTAVWDEIHTVLSLAYPDIDIHSVETAFQNTVNLYNGRCPNYRACNTKYHDLSHSVDTCLAMARLIHGAYIDGHLFTKRNVITGLVSALLHDAGFIQDKDDREGTGAKYTASHVKRSADFLTLHADAYGLTKAQADDGRAMILYTDLAINMADIEAPSQEIALLGQLLGAADLFAQMADRYYLEKLLHLYHEFKEAKIGNYDDQVDLLHKTVGFFDLVNERLAPMKPQLSKYLRLHFAARWDIDSDLYKESISRHKSYLKAILSIPNTDPRDYLTGELPPPVYCSQQCNNNNGHASFG